MTPRVGVAGRLTWLVACRSEAGGALHPTNKSVTLYNGCRTPLGCRRLLVEPITKAHKSTAREAHPHMPSAAAETCGVLSSCIPGADERTGLGAPPPVVTVELLEEAGRSDYNERTGWVRANRTVRDTDRATCGRKAGREGRCRRKCGPALRSGTSLAGSSRSDSLRQPGAIPIAVGSATTRSALNRGRSNPILSPGLQARVRSSKHRRPASPHAGMLGGTENSNLVSGRSVEERPLSFVGGGRRASIGTLETLVKHEEGEWFAPLGKAPLHKLCWSDVV